VVVKIGSAVLRDEADFDRVTFVSLAHELAWLRSRGLEVVVVCSGAVALGLARLGRTERPVQLDLLQATAAIGQGRLMRLWDDELAHHGQTVGQVLLTHDGLRDRKRYLAARHTLRALIELGAVPVINENDTVAFDEIKLGDNDLLSSQIVSLVGAGMLILLSDVRGLLDRDPSESGAQTIHRVERVDSAVLGRAGTSGTGFGSGGMRTKLEAVRQVNQLGVPAILAHGKRPGVLRALHGGEEVGTWFDPEPNAMSLRKHWIAYALRPEGTLHVDEGAVVALRERGRSLLPIGVTAVVGTFGVGDLVDVVGPSGAPFARGLVSHDAETIREVLGRRSADHQLDPGSPEIVHRDDLVLLSD